MAKGILYVETWPSAPEREVEFHTWYDEIHLPEVVALEGFTAGRRLTPVNGDGPFVAIYEIEADDFQAVVDHMLEVHAQGGLRMSDSIQLDPEPSVRLLRQTTVYAPP
ncbi:hypothetical protein CBI38_22320 [Rhodococcus oxybenzonivorans]|uniref:EthD domain-containing protein n=1 Tax=Rhodococcus oxybenzonivorans TaxID=1990687 RepID=A0A2S2C4A3_9NOCA|nr:DUF4286 family protein [Rhodococcus oxybenzonivorans]AWK75747.1 hypothetical protein CBI38_22320 [Rhodococcus oxybenzonivorans]